MAVGGKGGDYTPNRKGRKSGYDWGDGKGKVHSRPKRSGSQLNKAVQKKRDAATLDDPGYFTGPQTLRTALAEAERAGGLQYGGQQAQIAQQQRQVPAWFDQYRSALQTPQGVAQTYQPMIAQQQQVAQQTGQTTQGVDPNSQAGQQDALAAQARSALANLGAGVLQANQAADTTYFQGRQGVSQAAQIGMSSQLGQQAQQVAADRGAFQQNYLADSRTRERAYGIDLQHQAVENKAFDVDTAETFENIKTDRAKIRQSAKDKKATRKEKGQTVNSYGYTNEQWARFSPSHRQRIMRQQKSSGSSGGDAKPRFTPQQTSKANTTLRSAVALVQQGRNLPTGGANEYWRQAYDQLVRDGQDPAIARAAIQLVRGGKVGPKTRQTLKDDYGITRFPKGSKRKKPPGSSSGGGGGPQGTGRLSAYNPDTNKESAVRGKKRLGRGRRRSPNTVFQGPSRRQVS